jgi:hypothetical protein
MTGCEKQVMNEKWKVKSENPKNKKRFMVK